MPITPYHFGPSGLVGLACRRWIDVPVFVLANVAADCEVVLEWVIKPGMPTHHFLHIHTLLFGAIFGAAFGAATYHVTILRRFCEKSMDWFGLPYRPMFGKMVMAGILGIWFHVGIDCIHHDDVQLLWPFRFDNPVWMSLAGPYLERVRELRGWVVTGCLGSWALLAIYYGWLVDVFSTRKQRIEAIRKAKQEAIPTAISNN